MITMSEIARLTGVSQPTVSRVLNGNTSVNPEAAKKVLECAREHHYHPNMIARSLNGSRTCLLAVMVPDISNPFFADLIKVIEDAAAKEGYSILIFNSARSREREERYLTVLQQYRVDGLLLAPVHSDRESMKHFYQLTIPWIVFTNCVEDAHSVYISHRKAGFAVAGHLISIGVEKFVFIGKRKDSKFIGFEEGLRAGGIDIRQNLTTFWENDREKMLELLIEFLQEAGVRTGIFALNDLEALVVMNALMGAGISIPEQAALVGFDNTFISQRVLPGITSIDQPIEEMGSLAVKELLGEIGKKKRSDVLHTELDARLVVRESTVKEKEH